MDSNHFPSYLWSGILLLASTALGSATAQHSWQPCNIWSLSIRVVATSRATWNTPGGPKWFQPNINIGSGGAQAFPQWAGAAYLGPMSTIAGIECIMPSSNSMKNSIWLLGSGASRHMTGRIDFLTDIYPIQSYLIWLLNGSNIIANFEGTAKLGPTLVIHNVLFVSNLMCNLISVSQLLNHILSMVFIFLRTFLSYWIIA